MRLRCWPLLLLLLLLLLPPQALAQGPRGGTLQDAASSGNGTALDVAGYSTVGLTIIGSSGADRVVNWEATQDGTNYVAISCQNRNSLALATTATATSTTAQLWSCPVAGMQKFRARLSGGSTGTVTVTGTALPQVSWTLPTNGVAPTFQTSLTTPTIYGGTAAGSTLTLNGTSNGSPSSAHVLLNPTIASGDVTIGTATPNLAAQTGTGTLRHLTLYTADGYSNLELATGSSTNAQAPGRITFTGTASSDKRLAVLDVLQDTSNASYGASFRGYIKKPGSGINQWLNVANTSVISLGAAGATNPACGHWPESDRGSSSLRGSAGGAVVGRQRESDPRCQRLRHVHPAGHRDRRHYPGPQYECDGECGRLQRL
jgi:hypothetical protein